MRKIIASQPDVNRELEKFQAEAINQQIAGIHAFIWIITSSLPGVVVLNSHACELLIPILQSTDNLSNKAANKDIIKRLQSLLKPSPQEQNERIIDMLAMSISGGKTDK